MLRDVMGNRLPDTSNQCASVHAHVPACPQGPKTGIVCFKGNRPDRKCPAGSPGLSHGDRLPQEERRGCRPLHAPALVSSSHVGRAKGPWPLVPRQAPPTGQRAPPGQAYPRPPSPSSAEPNGSFIRSCSGETRFLWADVPGPHWHGFPLPPPGTGGDPAPRERAKASRDTRPSVSLCQKRTGRTLTRWPFSPGSPASPSKPRSPCEGTGRLFRDHAAHGSAARPWAAPRNPVYRDPSLCSPHIPLPWAYVPGLFSPKHQQSPETLRCLFPWPAGSEPRGRVTTAMRPSCSLLCPQRRAAPSTHSRLYSSGGWPDPGLPTPWLPATPRGASGAQVQSPVSRMLQTRWGEAESSRA